MRNDEMQEKYIRFGIKMNNLRKYLCEQQHEYNNGDQIQRSGTSIGANYSEACFAETDIDFIHKMGIAQKEAYETMYWLKVLYGSELISQTMYDEYFSDVEELMRMITSSIVTVKTRLSTKQ